MLTLSVAQAEPLRVVALGDSLTAGYGLGGQEGLVPQLEEWLTQKGVSDVTLVNAGVSGDTTRGGLMRLDWALADGADAMIVALGGNDLLRAIDPDDSRANLEAILQEAEARDIDVLLVGLKASQNFGPEFKSKFDSMYPELAQAFDVLYFEDYFAGLEDYSSDPVARRPFFLPDGLHPNAVGITKIVEAMGPAVVELLDGVRKRP